MINPAFSFTDLTESDVSRVAQEIAFLLQPGDTLALEGDLGAGKSTFARALIRAISGNPELEIPSPTFTLVQAYETPRFDIAHFDLYRLSDASEIDELGLDAALTRGIAVIEWPSRGNDRIPRDRFTIRFDETAAPDRRNVSLETAADLRARLERFTAIRDFLAGAGWGDASTAFSYLQGDASPRRYARLQKADGSRAILMDSPQRPDGPPIRDGKSYSAIAHLAESVKAFVAIDGALDAAGLSVPRIIAEDLAQGLLIIEDFGDKVFGAELKRGSDQASLWTRGVDTLIAVQSTKPPSRMRLSDGTEFILPEADEGVLEIETQLLLDWYWPALHSKAPPQSARDAFTSLWKTTFKRLLSQPKTWLLRDFHSPNLIALDDRPSPRDVGIIDFQDAMIGPAAYDLVSLLQDARVDVPKDLENQLLDHYVAAAAARNPKFDQPEFRFSYAALGAQRNTKILGIFARLAMRDGKRQYLTHMPRIWGYLERDLQHEGLTALKAWYDENLPRSLRAEALKI
ncbi:MAG: tRNA (adenosine(37)-N6)-threonylcarbamoyltransferase complex ATPase subunit type 1 TsaE [Proteobacteria bacterium]|nr:tRNA (adenosine(37)-N6)-threonylcarbamoyltransferase complex ATPase subunit type 1 TsaE [Pseudomonadota bacterium]